MIFRRLLSLCFAALLTSPAFARDSPTDPAHMAAEALILSEMDRSNIPGFSLVVVKDGEIEFEKHAGYSNVELGVFVDEHTAFSIASMSKTYTAAGILLLAERGEVDLEDSIRKYLPDAPQTWQEITLQQLISHTSGLEDDWGFNDDWDETPNSLYATSKSNDEFLESLYERPLLFRPGTGSRYACGTMVLGVVIEEVTGMSYELFMREEIFEPLGLGETWVDGPNVPIPHRAKGYLFENEKLREGHSLSAATLARGDVSIRASARDVAKWFGALRGGQLLEDQSRPFQWASLNDGSLVPRSLGGWFVWYVRGTKTIDHGGNYRSGFSSIMVEFFEDDLRIILLTNLADLDTFSIVQSIAAIYNPDYEFISNLPIEEKPSEAPDREFEQLLGSVVAGNRASSVMHERFPLSFYENLKRSFVGVSGIEFVGRRDVSAKGRTLFGEPLDDIWFYRLSGERVRHTTFYTDANGKVLFVEIPE